MIVLALTMIGPALGGALILHLWQTRPPKPRPPMAVYRRRTDFIRPRSFPAQRKRDTR